MWRWDATTTNTVALVLMLIALFLLLLLCILSVVFCRKSRSGWSGETSMLPPPGIYPHDDSYCFNDGFDVTFADETCARRIEERRIARQSALYCEDPRADVTLNRLDRSVGAALAVEQLLRDSYVFDTRVLPRPAADVKVIAAKRDYL